MRKMKRRTRGSRPPLSEILQALDSTAPPSIGESHWLPVMAAGGSVPVRIFEDAAGLGEALPRLAMALGAELRRGHDALGLKTAAAALDLEDGDAGHRRLERVVRSKLPLRREPVHADRHCNSPSIKR